MLTIEAVTILVEMRVRSFVLFLLFPLSFVGFARGVEGDASPVHDPSVIHSHGLLYVFCTGPGLPIRLSTDLYHWQAAGTVFAKNATAVSGAVPEWARAFTGGSASLWAPDITFFRGQYHVYYAASTFGETRSAIGLVTSPTLDARLPTYSWTDRGPVIQTHAHGDVNAIDPAVFVADERHVWMVFGSCWSGLKLVAINPDSGLLAEPPSSPLALACRPNHRPIEEGYLTHRGNFYYLWASFDHCCRGSKSDYSLVVGRSSKIAGPYVDRDGVAMMLGGGTDVLASEGDARGPGSSSVLNFHGVDYLIHHFYDAARHGSPTLQVRPLAYDTQGWPVVGTPIAGPISH